MKGIYRKRFSSSDLREIWGRDGETVDLEPIPTDIYLPGMFEATFSDGHTVTLFDDEFDLTED